MNKIYGVRIIPAPFFCTYCKFYIVFPSHIAVQFLRRKGYYENAET